MFIFRLGDHSLIGNLNHNYNLHKIVKSSYISIGANDLPTRSSTSIFYLMSWKVCVMFVCGFISYSTTATEEETGNKESSYQ
jgi:hypothetical protein